MKRWTIFLLWLATAWVANGQAKAFHLSEVRLLESDFLKAQQVDMEYILALDMDRLLAPYLREAGLAPKAPNYPNWESGGLDGHVGGHYLSALAMMAAATGDQQIKDRLDYYLAELKRAQDASGNGYLSGIPGGKAMWADVAAGRIQAGSFDLNKKWVPLYNIHKIYAGLRDAYLYAGSEQAKEMLIALTDWIAGVTQNLTDAQIQDMLRSEHGGLNEVFADVAAITGEARYVELARRFSHQRILEPLLAGKDELTGMHANTQIPKVIGFKRIADVDADEDWHQAADYFWQTVTGRRSVSIGGNSVREHFHPITDFSSMITSEQGPETCNTYNMLRLTAQLFLSQPSVHYMDYYERAMYNHILSTVHPEKPGFVYFTPMRPGHYRVYSQPETSFWCCVGSGLENHAKYGELIYAHNDKDLYVNLFIPSQLTWNARGLEVMQQTRFPDEESTTLIINPAKTEAFTVYLRYPSWVKAGALSVEVNGKKQEVKGQPGDYVAVSRKWKKGDQIKLTVPMHLQAEQLPDGSGYYSFLQGPVVLAAKTSESDQPGVFADDSRGGHIADGPKYALDEMPVLIGQPDEVVKQFTPVAGQPLTFEMGHLHPSQYAGLQLMPFYRLHESRYMLYWQVTTAEALAAAQQQRAAEEAARQVLEAATVDMVYAGEQQPESDHLIESENTESGVYEGRHWRHARGWFSYLLKDAERQAGKLQVMYSGPDSGRHFRILVNEEVLAEVKLTGDRAGFFTVDYTLPKEMIQKANGQYRVKFEAMPGSMAGGVYEVRLMRHQSY